MKETKLAVTEEDLSYLLNHRKTNMQRSLNNPNENWVFKGLPKENRNGLALSWERQYIFGYRILDFYCKEIRVAVEADGPEHDKNYDNYRDEYLFRIYGVVTLRVRNNNQSDLDAVCKQISSMGNRTFGNRNLLFKDILGPNSSHVDRESLARDIPYDDEHCLMGRYLLKTGYKSDYQTFRKKGKKHWDEVQKIYHTGTRKTDRRHMVSLFADMGLKYTAWHKAFIFKATDEELKKFKRYKLVTEGMRILLKDFTWSFDGEVGVGLDSFLSMFNKKPKNNLVTRATSPFKEYGSIQDEAALNSSSSITLEEYIAARCGSFPKALSDKEAAAFRIPLTKGWYEKHRGATVEISRLKEVLVGVLEGKRIKVGYKRNIRKFLRGI